MAAFAVAWIIGCSGDDAADGDDGADGSPEQTGSVCEVAADCYPEVVDGELSGEAMCLDRVRGGYCTHECVADEDCCAAEGECETDLSQVCSPFESTGQMLCFLSCEPEDIEAAPGTYADSGEYCQREASREFICRSSGGGSDNRQICVPGDCGVGAACSDDADCNGDLTCLTAFDGGYCGQAGCSSDAECPTGSHGVEGEAQNYCFRACDNDSDCSFCRNFDDDDAECSGAATLVDPGATGSVCVPR